MTEQVVSIAACLLLAVTMTVRRPGAAAPTTCSTRCRSPRRPHRTRPTPASPPPTSTRTRRRAASLPIVAPCPPLSASARPPAGVGPRPNNGAACPVTGGAHRRSLPRTPPARGTAPGSSRSAASAVAGGQTTASARCLPTRRGSCKCWEEVADRLRDCVRRAASGPNLTCSACGCFLASP